jgi:signal transduction histidine kinase
MHGFVQEGPPHHYRKEGRTYVCLLKQVHRHLLATVIEVTGELAREERRRSFLSVAAHDLRGPLANVRAYASLLLRPNGPLDERSARVVEGMGRNTDRALHLADGLFDLWNAELGALGLELTAGSLLPYLRAARAEANQRAEARTVEIATDYPNEAPPILADSDRVGAILSAFWDNALARSLPGQRVESALSVHDGSVQVDFLDQGAPLTEEDCAHAFEAGYVTATTRKLDARFELCVAAALIQAHGGAVEAGQLPSKTRFSFTLPRARATFDAASPIHQGPNPGQH